MKKLEALIQTNALDAAHAAVREHGFRGMTAHEVHDFGRRTKAAYRGVVYDRECQPTMKLELIVPDADVRRVAALLLPFACPNREGVGEIFVSPVSEVIRARAERGELTAKRGRTARGQGPPLLDFDRSRRSVVSSPRDS